MDEARPWTIDELVDAVARELAVAGGGPVNGRVREVPDRRAVRWYTTVGLLDRPELRGRTGYYGWRHLLQVVAVKRRQAEGVPLATIQADLAGAPDEELARIAGLPVQRPTVAPRVKRSGAEDARSATPKFWAARPNRAPEVAATERPAVERQSGESTAAVEGHGIRLAPGVLMVLDGPPPDARLLAEISAAAEPLLRVLAARTTDENETDKQEVERG